MLNHYPLPSLMAQERPSHSSYIKKSTTPMSRPTRPQMISPSPTCTTRGTTPRTTSSAPTVTSRSSWTGGNLEGHNGAPATSARRCLRSVGGDCTVTSRHKTQDVARAHHRQVRGRRVRYVREFDPPAHCQGRQQCLQGRVLSQDFRGSELSSSSDKNLKENRGRVVKSQVKIQSCIVIIYFLACQDDSQSCRRSPRGECWNKAEDHAKGPIRGKLPVTIVYLCLTFSA